MKLLNLVILEGGEVALFCNLIWINLGKDWHEGKKVQKDMVWGGGWKSLKGDSPYLIIKCGFGGEVR